MRFTAFTSAALAIIAAVNAIPTGHSDSQEFAIRDLFEDAAIDQRDTSFAENESNSSLEARAKFKASKISLSIPKKLKQGSISQSELESTTELVKCAMFEAGVTNGEVLYGWHGADTSSKDPVSHVTVKPTEGTGATKGNIHVHKDGSWSQGTGGKITGKGTTC